MAGKRIMGEGELPRAGETAKIAVKDSMSPIRSLGSSDRRRRLPIALIVLALILGLARPVAAATECIWSGVERIVAIGDLHGGYDQFVRLLKAGNLINSDEKWIGGKTHLVQMGDVFDRGNRAKDIFALIRKLEKQAEADGGRVHMLIGNHEELNLIGRSLDYEDFVTERQFFDFLPRGIRNMWEAKLGGRLSWEDWKDIIGNDGDVRQQYYKAVWSNVGNWIVEHNVVIKINRTVFVHGGLTESFAAMGLPAINALYHSEIKNESVATPIVFQPAGPLWNRSLADIEETDERHATIDRILAAVDADRIVVAHTPSNFHGREPEMQRYDGKVWCIDTGISLRGRVWGIIIDEGGVHVLKGGTAP
jgi:hypothetical protein